MVEVLLVVLLVEAVEEVVLVVVDVDAVLEVEDDVLLELLVVVLEDVEDVV